VPDPLELLAESCKRICPASVKAVRTEPKNKLLSNQHITTATTTTTNNSSGSENSERLEQHEGPTSSKTVGFDTDDHTSGNDEDRRMIHWQQLPLPVSDAS